MSERKLSTLAKEIHKRKPFESAEQEAHLNIVRTAAAFEAAFERLFKKHGLSGATYNVLRILRGAGEAGRACHEIGDHMVTHVPDVTRLVDRLETLGLAARTRTSADRRVVTIRITAQGMKVLERLDKPTIELHAAQLGHLSRKELETLSELLVKARQAVPDVGPE